LFSTNRNKKISTEQQQQRHFSLGSIRFLHASSSLSRKNYYEVLGVPKNASAKDVKKSYYELANKFHPDKNPSADAKKSFQEVSEAYEVRSFKYLEISICSV
jgi:preprotein translocase subunit Sec63